MSDTGHIKCPRCGKELPVSAPEGLCPACLGALNFATETELPGVEAREALPPLTPQELAPHFPQLEILECLGRGGMGVVYKARQRTLNRLVALKLLAPERVQDAKFADRFAREAQALAALNHPNIVTIHDFGKAGGFYYLLMEFVDGLNLRQLLRSRKLQSSEALAIVPPVCEALQYAHEHGIVHRDIKPENLLLAKDGRVKIADFGIAKMLGSDSTNSSISLSSLGGGEGRGGEAPNVSVTQHTTLGTPQYMAPEQRDQSQSADHRADIYSLGVVLYELLTGELPADKLQPPSKKVQIDVRLDEVVLRALEKTPALRYQTAGEFKTQVESVAVKSSEKNAPEKDVASASTPNRGPLPRALKAIICWLLMQGGLALSHNLFNFIQWNQVHLNLIGLNLAAGFGLMTLRTGWWRFALVMNAAQMLSSLLGVPLALAPAPMWDRFLSPMEAFRTQPVFLAIWVLMQIVTITTCVLVHFNLLRLRREGWFGPVAEEQKKIEYAIATVTFYTGIILGIVIVSLMPFRFSRDAAYLLVVGIMVALSPLVGMFIGNALRQAEQQKQAVQLMRIRKWLDTFSILAWALALPVVGFGIFFLFGSLSKVGGWNPATSEAVLIPLTWLGAGLLPWAAVTLRRVASMSGRDVTPTPASSFRALLIPGIILLVVMLAGMFWRSDIRQKEQAQAARQAETKSLSVYQSLRPTSLRQISGAPFIAHLPFGGSVELLAVRLHPQNTNQPWWQPDGSPSRYGADITIEGPDTVGLGVLGLVKIDYPVAPPHKDVYGVSISGSRFALKTGLRLPLEDFRVMPFENVITKGDETTLFVQVGVQDWETAIVLQPGLGGYLAGGAARRQWDFSETSSGNLKVSIKNLIKQAGMEYQLVAVDNAGKYHTPSIFKTSSTTGKAESEFEALFDAVGGSTGGLKPAEVKEAYWQQRPYDTIEFRNVSLKPGHLTKVEIKDFGTGQQSIATGNTANNSFAQNAPADSPLVITPTPTPSSPMIPFIRILLLVLLLGFVIGSVVLTIWLSRKKGLKGCLLAGAIMLGVLLGLVGLVLLLSFGYRAAKANAVHAPAGTTLEMHPISQIAPPPQPNGLAMQVQNGFRFKASGAQLVTFEFFMRQGDDRLVPLPQLTARLAMASNYSLESSIYWAGIRGDDARGTNQLWSWSVHAYGQTQQPLPSRPDYETNLTYHLRSGEVLNWWQLAMPTQVNLMPGSSPQDIPIFRTFGSATLDSKQPKEAIVRVTCEALPAGYQFGREQFELMLGNHSETQTSANLSTPSTATAIVPKSKLLSGTATLVQAYEPEIRWRWRVTKEQPARILFGITDSDREGVLGTIVPISITENLADNGSWALDKDIVLTTVKKGDSSELKLEEKTLSPRRSYPQMRSQSVNLQSTQQIISQSQPITLSSAYYQTLWEAEIVRHSADGKTHFPRRLRLVARLADPELAENIEILSENDPVKEVREVPNSPHSAPPQSANAVIKAIKMRSATNQSGAISLFTNTPLLPGEIIQPVLRFEDGRWETGGIYYFINRSSEAHNRESFSLSWQPFPSLAPELSQAAVEQIRERWGSNAFTLTSGQATKLFTVTNAAGVQIHGEVNFQHITANEINSEAIATLNLKDSMGVSSFVSANFNEGTVPQGYLLIGKGEFPQSFTGDAHTAVSRSNIGLDGHVTWFLRASSRISRPGMARLDDFKSEQEMMSEAARQLNNLASRGLLKIRAGYPVTVFSVTNSAGEVFKGSLELVGNKP